VMDRASMCENSSSAISPSKSYLDSPAIKLIKPSRPVAPSHDRSIAVCPRGIGPLRPSVTPPAFFGGNDLPRRGLAIGF
jgi:hypothetical protein